VFLPGADSTEKLPPAIAVSQVTSND